MSRQLVRKPASWAKRDQNARQDYGDEDKLRALARSRAKHQITPLVARTDGTLIDGFRTIKGLELEGMLSVELDFIVTDEPLTKAQIRAMQFASAVHREDLSPYDRAMTLKMMKDDNPGMTGKQLAEEVDLDPAQISRLLSLFDCVPEVQAEAKAGRIGITDWYTISRSPDQNETLRLKLGGANREEMARHVKERTKPETEADTVKSDTVKIELAGEATVTVKGKGLTLAKVVELLSTACKEADKGKSQGLSSRSFSNVMRDRARKPAKAK